MTHEVTPAGTWLIFPQPLKEYLDMKYLLLIPLIAFTCLTHAIPQPRIIGGEVSTASYSWMVSLQNDSGHFCGGVLISDRFVVTAAHCLKDFLPSELKMIIGSNDRINGSGGEVARVDWFYIHSDFDNATYLNDIGVIKLAEPVMKQPIKVMSEYDFNEINQNDSLKVMGWGLTVEGDETSSPVFLNEVDVSFQRDFVCQNAYGSQGVINYWNYAFCAGEISGGEDSCLGDSGGPIVVQRDGEWLLSGIVSWGIGCGQPDKFGVYTQVSAFQDWLYQRLYGLTLVGVNKIGFLAEGAMKHEAFRLINHSNQALLLNQSFFESSSFNAFEQNLGIEEIPAASECEFSMGATGNNVGEQNARFTIGNNYQITDANLNAKVLKLLDIPTANLPWPFYSGTKTSNAISTEHSEPWYAVNAGEDGIVLRSGDIDHNERSILLTYLAGPEESEQKYFRFEAKVESELPDGLYAFVNEKIINAVSLDETQPHVLQQAGQYNRWSTYQLALTKSVNHIMLMYRKDATSTTGLDTALIKNFQICTTNDQIEFTCGAVSTDFQKPSQSKSLLVDSDAICQSIVITIPEEHMQISELIESHTGGVFNFFWLVVLVLTLHVKSGHRLFYLKQFR